MPTQQSPPAENDENLLGDVGQVGPLEEAIARIPGVTGARVVSDPTGRIAEVHVLSTPERPPKQLVRDVQSVAVTGFGIEIDYRKISVVQLAQKHLEEVTENEAGDLPGRNPLRLTLSRVTTEVSGPAATVSVELSLRGEPLRVSKRGTVASAQRLVVQGVLDAVGEVQREFALEIEFAGVLTVSETPLALALVRAIGRRGQQTLAGCAVVRADPSDSLARAALDAVNRLVTSV